MQQRPIDNAAGIGARPVVPKRPGTSPEITVLVVEDEALVRLNAKAMLEAAGYRVREAGCGPTGIEQLHLHGEVSVLFTDIDMPGAFDGLDLARHVHLLRPDIHLIVTSGRTQPSRHDLCGGDFVAKPYSDRAVADMIRAAAGRRFGRGTAPT